MCRSGLQARAQDRLLNVTKGELSSFTEAQRTMLRQSVLNYPEGSLVPPLSKDDSRFSEFVEEQIKHRRNPKVDVLLISYYFRKHYCPAFAFALTFGLCKRS